MQTDEFVAVGVNEPARRRASERGRNTQRAVLVIGVSPDMNGGVASVLAAYRSCGLPARMPVRFVQSADAGSGARKIARVVQALGIVGCALIRGSVGLAHVHTSSGASFWRKSLFVGMCRAAGVPVLLHIHGGTFIDFIERLGPRKRALALLVLQAATRIIALTPGWRASLARIARHERIDVIANGVPIVAAPAPRVGDETGRDVLLFLGQLNTQKGLPELIRAFARVSASRPNVRLICAGDADARPFERIACEVGVQGQVVFPGWIDAAARIAWLDRARALVLPSHAENLPMSLLEAMIRGVPVVATRVGGIPDAVSDGTHGVLIAPGDTDALTAAIESMFCDDERWRHMSREAHRHASERYSAPVMVDAVANAYARYGLRA